MMQKKGTMRANFWDVKQQRHFFFKVVHNNWDNAWASRPLPQPRGHERNDETPRSIAFKQKMEAGRFASAVCTTGDSEEGNMKALVERHTQKSRMYAE
jgi:hypothetical protein